MKSAPGGSDDGLFAEVQQGGIVIHAVIAQHAAVAVRGVFAEAGVGHDDHFRHGLFADAGHAGDKAIFFPRIAAGGIGMMGDAKGHHRADPRVGDAFDLTRQIFFRNAHHARHGFDGFVVIDLFFNKNRQHQIV
jgi:hypothetical protein